MRHVPSRCVDELLLCHGRFRDSERSRRLENLGAAILQETCVGQIVGMILVSDADRRHAPGVLQLRVQRDIVRFHRKRSAVTVHLHAARKFPEPRLVGAAPAGTCSSGSLSPHHGLRPDARIESAAAIVTALRIGIIEVVQDSRDLHALEFVQLVLEHSERA